MNRRQFLNLGFLGGVSQVTQEFAYGTTKLEEGIPLEFPLYEKSIVEIRKMLDSGEFTIEEIVNLYLQRIYAFDKQGPKVNAVISINPLAIPDAQKLDVELKSGKSRGVLHGIPILVKDNIDIKSMTPTTGGSIALEQNYPKSNAGLIEKLLDAGVVILGKTNLSEWANFRSTRSSSGWSGFGGQTLNPYFTDRSPCGSSSGSGVAVASNFCSVAIGTETDGSIVCPSNVNGIVGLKPTVGLVSGSGIIPISSTQDTAGPMAKSVLDAAILLKGMAVKEIDCIPDTTLTTLKGIRLGFDPSLNNIHEEVSELFLKELELLKSMGATIIETVPVIDSEIIENAEYQVLLYEFKDGLNKYLANANPNIPAKSLEELIAFNLQLKDIELKYFEQEIFEQAQLKNGLDDSEYKESLQNSHVYLKERITTLMKKYSIDAFVAPTGGPAWVVDPINGDNYLGSCSSIAAISGNPHLTVPMGFIHGLPVGISFFGEANSEKKILEIGYVYERNTHHRQPPYFQKGAKQLTGNNNGLLNPPFKLV